MRANIYSPSPLNKTLECYLKWQEEKFGLDLRKTFRQKKILKMGKIGTQESVICRV